MSGDVQTYVSDAVNISQVEVKPLEEQLGPYMPLLPNTTTTSPTTIAMVQPRSTGHVLAYILVPLGCLAIIITLSFLVLFILRKSRMDRLRHHLMPLYNFDPMEEEGDWESELLEEEKQQTMALNIRSPSERGPKLKFHTDT